jgi:sulfoxide reductase heme-binding subunit YedZ
MKEGAARPSGNRARRKAMKLATGVVGIAPAVVIATRFVADDLGANPIERAMNQLGLWTLILLLVTLACSPLKWVTGWTWPLVIRRMLGLLSFAYVCLHFLVYLVLDQGLDLAAVGEDIVKRKFITVGFLGFLLLIPLAATSSGRMVKRLGFPRWQRLHRLTYVATAAGVVHFIWRVKSDLTEPLIYAGVFGLLMAMRLVAWLRPTAPSR